uniref:Protein kinase domain-containing protein n=1 Tax=Lactuca sativa TaxID=4236 RepID=A0A9R1XX17_LACSA|nr:hypothetical protein LSAT_V11C100044180 [Lactuca sativa]
MWCVSSSSRPIASAVSLYPISWVCPPGNVLFDEFGVAKVTDFGLSKIVEDDVGSQGMELTSQGVGTYCWSLKLQSQKFKSGILHLRTTPTLQQSIVWDLRSQLKPPSMQIHVSIYDCVEIEGHTDVVWHLLSNSIGKQKGDWIHSLTGGFNRNLIHTGNEVSKAPQIQRLVTPSTLQRKRARLADNKKRIGNAEPTDYHLLLHKHLRMHGYYLRVLDLDVTFCYVSEFCVQFSVKIICPTVDNMLDS